MTFVKIEAYDGERGYVKRDELHAYTIDGAVYLVNPDEMNGLAASSSQGISFSKTNIEHLYRVNSDNIIEGTAQAVRITDKSKQEELTKKINVEIEKRNKSLEDLSE